MEESTDVDRMLARLGETNIRYREFGDLTGKTARSWTAPSEAIAGTDTRVGVARLPQEVLHLEPRSGAAPVGSWNTSREPAPPRLTPEPLLIDPEGPGGRLAAAHVAGQRAEPIPDAVRDGRTAPASLNATVSEPALRSGPASPAQLHPDHMTPSQILSPIPAAQGGVAQAAPARPVVPAAESVQGERASGGLDGLFRRVSGDQQTSEAPSKAAPLSSLFKRLS